MVLTRPPYRRSLLILTIAVVALPAAFATSPATAQLPFYPDCVMEDGTEAGEGSTTQTTTPSGTVIELTCRRGRWVHP